jgi:hypothetical protein
MDTQLQALESRIKTNASEIPVVKADDIPDYEQSYMEVYDID